MNKESFIENFRMAFGDYELPIGFWYSDEPTVEPKSTEGCFIKYLKLAREGKTFSLNEKSIDCPGGKTYLGFTNPSPMGVEYIANKELYKQSPKLVTDWIEEINTPDKSRKYINFASLNEIEDFNALEGLIFFATPDVLSGLVSWVQFDTNEPDAISVPFGSGCSTIITRTIVENRKNGRRTFLGMFDPSARPSIESNILTLAIPMSRFNELYYTIEKTCLSGTKDWTAVKERITNGGL